MAPGCGSEGEVRVAKSGFVPFWMLFAAFWNSRVALSNSLLARPIILASSGIFCGPQRNNTMITPAMVASSSGSKAMIAVSS